MRVVAVNSRRGSPGHRLYDNAHKTARRIPSPGLALDEGSGEPSPPCIYSNTPTNIRPTTYGIAFGYWVYFFYIPMARKGAWPGSSAPHNYISRQSRRT